MLKTVLFILLGGFLLGKIQDILTPKWMEAVHLENTVRGIDELEGNVDVLFLGASHGYHGVSPMEIYANYGICSYVLSTPTQPIPASYFLLEKAYETQAIETVVLDVSMMFLEPWDGGIRYVLDTLEYGSLKYEIAKVCAENGWEDNFLSAFFPIIRFHSSWNILTELNFKPHANTYSYSLGQVMFSTSASSGTNLELLNNTAETLSQYHGRKMEAIGDEIITEEIQMPLYVPYIPEKNLRYFLKIKELCENHGSKLLLMKVPVMTWPQFYGSTWTQIKSSITKELAESYDLKFLDLLYDVESLVSFDTDTLDGGMHLNSSGAKKVSNYLGEYLLSNHLAESKTDPVYDELLKKYQKVDTIIELQMTTDFYEYIGRLKELEKNKTVLVAAAYDYAAGMTSDDYAQLKDLGLTLIENGQINNSYVGILSDGNTLYEAVSDYRIEYGMQILNIYINMSSRNWWITEPGCSIQVNNVEYARSGQDQGLTFVIYDHETDCVIDSVTFYTCNESKPCTRDSSQTQNLLNNYESILCFDGR